MPRAAPLLLLLLLALTQRRACLPGPATAAPLDRDPCLSQPCRNNGTCSPVPARSPAATRRLQLLLPQPPAAYSCACPAGVTGTSCQSLTSITWSATQNEPSPEESPYRSPVHLLKRSQSWCMTALRASLLVDEKHSVCGKSRLCSVLHSSAIKLTAGIWIVEIFWNKKFE